MKKTHEKTLSRFAQIFFLHFPLPLSRMGNISFAELGWLALTVRRVERTVERK